MPKNKLVCICNSVSEKEIISILKKGAYSLADIQRFTPAGTSCGRCRKEIEALAANYLGSRKPDPQQRIEFE